MDSLLIFIACLVCYIAFVLWQSVRRPKNFPPGPEFVPWVGNSMQLRKEAIAVGGQHKAFENWAKRYNSNVLGLKLGGQLFIVVLSHPLVKEINLGEVYEGRPDNFFFRLRTLGTRQGITCTDGKMWYEHRNFAMKEMRQAGYGRSQMDKHIANETESLLNFLEAFQGEPVWPATFLPQNVINVLWSMTAGKRFKCGDERMSRLMNLMSRRSKVFDMSGGILTQFPWLRFVAPNRTGYNLIRQLNTEMSEFFMETINEHKRTLAKENAESDLIYAYLREMKEEVSNSNENTTFNETQLTMTIMDLFIAGSQTTSTTQDLILMTLAMRPEMQKQIYDEIISNSQHVEFPSLATKAYYPYTDAFLMEVQRFYHIAPVTGPRRALWDTKLAGYDIPKNTTILMCAHTVLMDREHWGDPEVFRPERFLDAEGKTFKDEYFIPFGMGRRRCLGDAMARACLFSFTVKICEKFEVKLSDKEEDQPSLKLLPGITLSAKPYKIRFIKRC